MISPLRVIGADWEAGFMRKVIAIVGIAGLGLAWAALPATAGENPQFTISPESGPPGTVIHAADTTASCNFDGDFDVEVELIAPDASSVDEADHLL